MTYKGKPLTVVTMEMLARTLTDSNYLPPKNSIAYKIWFDGQRHTLDDVWIYIEEYIKDRPR